MPLYQVGEGNQTPPPSCDVDAAGECIGSNVRDCLRRMIWCSDPVEAENGARQMVATHYSDVMRNAVSEVRWRHLE